MKDLVKAIAEALNLMKTRKTAEPSSITSELLKVCKNNKRKKLVEVRNDLLQQKGMPESWRRFYKDVKSYGSYRSVKLSEHGMTVIKRIFQKQLRNVMKI